MSRSHSEARSTSAATRVAAESHRFVIEYFGSDGRRLGPIPVEPDFQAAREWAYFGGMRRGLLPAAPEPGPEA